MHFFERLKKKSQRNYAAANDMSVWAGALAHEIKNPLNTMRLNVDLLKEDWEQSADSPSESAKRRLGTLDREIGRLEEILNDFLRYARLPKPNPEKTNIAMLLNELLDFTEPEAQQLGINVVRQYSDDLPDVHIDKSQIKQALMNILLNAYQAMPDGGDVLVRADIMGSSIVADIVDNGEGISEDRIGKIFGLFYSTKEDGTGLGLPIAKRIVEMNNGEIRVKTQEGKGTTFSILLPIYQA